MIAVVVAVVVVVVVVVFPLLSGVLVSQSESPSGEVCVWGRGRGGTGRRVVLTIASESSRVRPIGVRR